MEAWLTAARRDELIESIAGQVRARHLQWPAILLLEAYAPLAFLGSNLLLAAQPWVGWFTGDRLARELALLSAEPVNLERLIARLEDDSAPR